ncbi:hypothetical protein QEZ54_19255 [Catellatospora sp. KI3]|uniref:hypothetical protein n=1 Tax=Catellatospora sp. KI3 TaxID=3041620 RepID=UPI0024823E91|nr:hypothetical protein [Catellatospora sp. KI3]MDI1463120.1 hypothetical protein [Catellatospora sp. KI3]
MAEQHGDDETGLGRGLAALAGHGTRIGRLRPAEQVRHRGERRRRNARLGVVASGLAVAALTAGVFAWQGQPGGQGVPVATAPPQASPSAVPSPSVTPRVDPSAVPGAGIPARDRAVWLQATATAGYPLLTALPDGTVSTTTMDGATDGALFALVPLSPGADEYLLKTGTIATWGEPGCAALEAARVAIVACDAARDEQRVTLGRGGPPFEVLLGGRALAVTGTGVAAVAPGQGTPLTFIVRGKAQDPFD